MKTIAVLNAKGGVGKTAISHLLSWVLADSGYNVVLLHTDARSESYPVKSQNRRYLTWPLRPHINAEEAFQNYHKARDQADAIENCIMVIDGGANRRNVDSLVAQDADLIMIPVGVSDGDITESIETFKRLREHREEQGLGEIPIRFVLSNWPGERRRLSVILKAPHIARFYRQTQNVRMDTIVTSMPSIVLVTDPTEPSMNLTLRRVGKELTDEVCKILKMPTLEDVQRVQTDQEPAEPLEEEIL